jgi:hypothetical protein
VNDSPVVHLPPLVGRQSESWSAFVELAPDLGEECLLVGGQMVFLHEVERDADDSRPTADVDLVVDLRLRPTALQQVNSVLVDADFDQLDPNANGIAHRYTRRGASLDVLAPDNIGPRAQLAIGAGRTIEAPGSTQAFARSERIQVVLATGESATIRRPTLVGAVLGKTAAVTKISSQTREQRAKHRRDVDSLARLVGAADRHGADLTRKEGSALTSFANNEELTELARRSLLLLAAPTA